MGFWPDVKRGDKVRHHMVLENNVRHLINSLDGFGSGMGRGAGSGVVRIQIWNASGGALAAGQPVAFDSAKEMCGDAVPAVKVTDKNKPYGVCVTALAAKGMGDCIIAGPAVVSLSGSSGDYAEPVVNGTGFARSETGTARVLFAGSKSIIVLGGAGNVDTYEGPFAITYDAEAQKLQVAAGYATLNGEWKEVGAASLTPQTGTICVCSTLGDGEWSAPEVKFATPSKNNYPIGTVKVEGSGEAQTVAVSCCRVPVVHLFDVGSCEKIVEDDN